MRLLTGIAAAALAGLAAAKSQDPAKVYLFKSTLSQSESSSSASPRIPKEVARHIMLQRVSRDPYGSPLRDIPNTIDEETAISYINTYGKSQPSLFDEETSREPLQLVMILEEAEYSAYLLQDIIGDSALAFMVSNPPSTKATDNLMADFNAVGAVAKEGCDPSNAWNPSDPGCWSDRHANVLRFELRKTSLAIPRRIISRIQKYTMMGEMEVLLVILPESSRTSNLISWSKSPASRAADELRRRDEVVLTNEPVSTPKSTAAPDAFWESIRAEKGSARIPNCFLSANSCETRTNSCSGGHGKCINRYKDQPNHEACFACHCMSTVVLDGTEPGAVGEKTIRWAGNMCQKKDVSIPFWLLTGFTITIVGAVTFAISLLYSVGEQQLPGVIGAGVSRSK